MRTFRLKIGAEARESTIVCRKNVFSAVLAPMRESLLRGGGLLFTDSRVYALYRAQIEKYLKDVPVYAMEAGEQSKNERTLFALLRAMAEAGLRRDSVLVALGGGVVGDVGALAASLYMRGISCVLTPTTLLAQADGAVGGKTAVDFCGVKNLVGSFYPAARVYADPVFLATLPVRELRCGLGEIVKHGTLCPPLFRLLEENRGRLFDLDFLSEVVPESIAFKASVVGRDPYDRSLRACLNLGHTTAHALELSGSELSHGECVLAGMIVEGRIALRFGECGAEFSERLESLCLEALGGFPKADLSEKTARLALFDKKNGAPDTVRLTVPRGLGAFGALDLPFEDYARLLAETGAELC